MEREILVTGVGGQGVQLASHVLARAATLEDREVSSVGLYGGMMRGGNTDCTIIVADAPISAPPLVTKAWALIALHDEFAVPALAKVRGDGVIFVNESTFSILLPDGPDSFRIPATERARELGNPVGGAMVMIGAFIAATGLVALDSAIEAMRQAIPSYRSHHIAANENALRAGFALTQPDTYPAWEVVSA